MIHSLTDGALDIVGDIHGESDALSALLTRLGYDRSGHHPQGRKLVFVGDLCDRGPDSPEVIDQVRRIVEGGNGQAILGNHEMNLLRGERKDGNDWFWNETSAKDRKYEPYTRLARSHRDSILSFLADLPLALERDDLRVVHAAWHQDSFQRATGISGGIQEQFNHWERHTDLEISSRGLLTQSAAEKDLWGHALDDPHQRVPLLKATGTCDELRQMANPLRVLTSGIERLTKEPFFSGGQWRFVERVRWWDEYHDAKAVVVGHYWRRYVAMDASQIGKGGPNLFETVAPNAWHGVRGNVFCVDFSVGGRFHERGADLLQGLTTKLAALRWPERTLVLDTGEEIPTGGFHA